MGLFCDSYCVETFLGQFGHCYSKITEPLDNHYLDFTGDATHVMCSQEVTDYLDGIYRAVQTSTFVPTSLFQFLDKLRDDIRATTFR